MDKIKLKSILELFKIDSIQVTQAQQLIKDSENDFYFQYMESFGKVFDLIYDYVNIPYMDVTHKTSFVHELIFVLESLLIDNII